MTEISPLEAREIRWHKKCNMAKKYHKPIISLTLNVPNKLKTQEKYINLHSSIFIELQKLLDKKNIAMLDMEMAQTSDGSYALLAVDYDDIKKLKLITTEFEESQVRYRLADIDIMDGEANPISRTDIGYTQRKCFICDDNAKTCIVGKKHSLDEIISAVEYLSMSDDDHAKRIADCALKGILYEVSSYPKPGLVTSNDNGSHSDMDIFTFIDSSVAIYPYLYELTKIGMAYDKHSSKEEMAKIRACGANAEAAMFRTTNGVNTHKGMIFAMGFVCVAAGIEARKGNRIKAKAISENVKLLLKGTITKELEPLKKLTEDELLEKKLTHGEKLYLKYDVTGARGEAENGFPMSLEVGLSALKANIEGGEKLNAALVNTLMAIMAQAQDTNVLKRGGREGLLFVQKSAREILSAGGISTPLGKEKINALDAVLKTMNISSGGAADMLALTAGVYLMEGNNA